MLIDEINVAEWFRVKSPLFGKMQRGRSPSFELFQLDMYGCRARSYKQLGVFNMQSLVYFPNEFTFLAFKTNNFISVRLMKIVPSFCQRATKAQFH